MKICPKCKTLKQESEFGKNASRKDGLHSECKKCKNAGNYKYYQTENARVVLQKWRKSNPEKMLKYRQNQKESSPKYPYKYPNKRYPEYVLNWQRKNADKIRAINNAYRTRKAGNGGSFTEKEWKDLCEKYGNKCLCCGKETKLAADHVIPVVKGGTSNIDNIQPLCHSCNSKKHTKETDYRSGKIVSVKENNKND